MIASPNHFDDLYRIGSEPFLKLFESELLDAGFESDLLPKVLEALKNTRQSHYHKEWKGEFSSQPSQCQSICPIFPPDYLEPGQTTSENGSMNETQILNPEFQQDPSQPISSDSSEGFEEEEKYKTLLLLRKTASVSVGSQEESHQKLNRDEENLQIIEKFFKKVKKGGKGNKGVFFAPFIPSKANVVEERVMKMATALARISLQEWMITGSILDEITTTSDVRQAIINSSFKSFAKLILRIFDMEDFERFNCLDKLTNECRKFRDQILLKLESNDDPFELVAKGKIHFDKYPLLREQDVDKLLDMFHYAQGGTIDIFVEDLEIDMVGSMDFGFDNDEKMFFKKEVRRDFVEMARTVLLQHVPVEEGIRIHSILDFIMCPCGRAVDELFTEAVCDVARNLELEYRLSFEQLYCLDHTICSSFSRLAHRKSDFLMDLSISVRGFLRRHYKIGHFTRTACNLVVIANALRRIEDHRFISKYHILQAFRLTKLKVLVDRLISGLRLRNVVGEHARCPPYVVYFSARALANYQGTYVVEVEHLAVATVFEIKFHGQNLYALDKEKHKEKLHEFMKRECVKKFFRDVYKFEMDYEEKYHISSILNHDARIIRGVATFDFHFADPHLVPGMGL